MAHPSKAKGDRAELEAVAWFKQTIPDLVVWDAQRMLGAGRAEDIGDLKVFADVAIQVKAYKDSSLSAGLYQAASGATLQAARARHPFAVGMVLVPRARANQVRWAASADSWPTADVELVAHTSSLNALAAVRAAGVESLLVTVVNRKGAAPIRISSMQTWLAAYRAASPNAN
jgi:hypothetical protein